MSAYFPDDSWGRPVRPSQHREYVKSSTFAQTMVRDQQRRQRDLAAATPATPKDTTRPMGAAAQHVMTPADAWQRDRELRAGYLAQLQDYAQLWRER